MTTESHVVVNVLLLSARKQVIWVHAFRDVTDVADNLSLRYLSLEKGVACTMGKPVLSIVMEASITTVIRTPPKPARFKISGDQHIVHEAMV
jgi:hypothetical protein